MQKFIKTIINAVQVWTSKKIEDKAAELDTRISESQADWSQNNPENDGYIRNRPFYEENIEVVWVEEQTITINENGYAELTRKDDVDWPNVQSPFEVIFDNVSYKGTTFDDVDVCTHTDFTTVDGYKITIIDANHLTTSPDLAGEHIIKITYIKAVTHIIDEKYLPEQKVWSVNNKTGHVKIKASDIDAASLSSLKGKMNKTNPTGTGSFSMNRKPGTTIGSYSHAEGDSTEASGLGSHAEGYSVIASGDYSHAEGGSNTASGDYSHAEGYNTIASGDYSHAEGAGTTASSSYSHAEGLNTVASKFGCHAEGVGTTASGLFSHAEGNMTIASGSYSHAEGKFNISDTTKTYAHIVGNGASDTKRSNAHTLDWDGNAWYAGDVYVGSTSGTNKDEGSKKLATEEYVDTSIENISVGGFVAQPEPPEDKSLLWVDIDDDSEEAGGNVDLTGYAKEQWVQQNYQPKGEYLESTALPTAVNDALAEAKESGEFKGEPGQPGKDGVDGKDGEDGYTPVKYVDYYTADDKAEFETQIIAEIAKRGQLKPEFANTIEECADTSMLYVLPDGYIYAYMMAGERYTNQIPISTDVDGSIYNGVGYKYDVRYSGSSNSETTGSGTFMSGYIPVRPGSVVRIRNITMNKETDNNHACTINFFRGYSDYVTKAQHSQWYSEPTTGHNPVWDDSLNLVQFTVPNDAEYKFVRLQATYIGADSIVTVDEEITESTGGYSWENTGHAFVPADYESRIIALENALNGTIFGIVDEENNIIMTGNIPRGTYTLKYQNADGTTSEIGKFDVE